MLNAAPRRQSGLSLVELLVGIAVGLFVVAAASILMTGQLADNRRLLLETQLQQDLRATADIIARDLRRAGSAGATGHQFLRLWSPTFTAQASPEYAEISPDIAAASEVTYQYMRDESTAETYGFSMVDGTVRTRIGDQWQALTDRATVEVTAFTVTPTIVSETVLPCPKLCPDGTEDCWPSVVVRDYLIEIAARSAQDPSTERSIRTRVRVQNDWLRSNTPGSTTQVCPP